MNQNQSLEALLLSMFDQDSLRRFVRYLPDGNRLFESLPNSESEAQQASCAARLLVQHGYTQEPIFWNALLAERPRRRRDIEDVASKFVLDKSNDRRRNLVILMAGANPDHTARIRIGKEQVAISQRIRSSRFRDSVKLISETSVSFPRLTALLAEHQPNVLHLNCHGDKHGIELEEEGSAPSRVSAEVLSQLLRAFKDSLRIVVLNASYSSEIAKEITPEVPLAIGTRGPLADEAAAAFGSSFYEALCFGRSVESSFEIATINAKHLHSYTELDLFPQPGDDNEGVRKLRLVQADA